MAGLIVAISGLKAYLFYLAVRIISRFDISYPFSQQKADLISKMSGIALQVGITAVIAGLYANWLWKQPIHFSYDGGETDFLFLAAILFVIAPIFKRGIELQSENELTI